MSSPSPARIMAAVHGHHQTAAIGTAVELGLFTAIGMGHSSAEALSEHCHASEKGIRILCDFLVIHEFLTKNGTDYALTPETALFLDRRSPAYFGGVAAFLASASPIRMGFSDLTAVVRKGGSILNDEGGTVSRENPVWEEFARSMVAMMAPSAEAIAQIVNAPEGKPMKVLDLAAGHGLFGITIARQNPAATVYAVDWHNVLEIAREHAIAAGVAARWNEIEGSAFEVEFGGDYDLALITNFHHHFNKPTIETLMRKVCAAMKPEGVVVTLEFVPNDDRISPPDAASFAMMMLATTTEGDAYTFAEYDELYKNSGFTHNELHRLPNSPQAVILSRR
ncbi:MAG: class I SAM-dependent methyltransferase [Bryobacterales bacterium]|nr:class I SAM-dependent methyltransferase [Bryobacterales bacterium]